MYFHGGRNLQKALAIEGKEALGIKM